ncbi:MAG: hypothetical protein HQM10_14145 [Candidatus Riflebacteria bacterium]|nr:hypothetical protein [Candidatus Riflebacteria bacterium]
MTVRPYRIACLLAAIIFSAQILSAAPARRTSTASSSVSMPSSNNTSSQNAVRKWTVMIFMAADNNLEKNTEADLNELESVGSTKDLNIVVQLDRSGNFSSATDFKWSGCKRFLIVKDNQPTKVTSPAVQDLGEIDSATSLALIDFVKWTKASYPAEKYALILWNHGTGWKKINPDGSPAEVENSAGLFTFPAGTEFGNAPVSSDDNSDRPRNTTETHLIPELQKVINTISYNISYDDTTSTSMNIPTLGKTLKSVTQILGKPLDFFGFDACLMQMLEVAHEVAPYAKYQVASPDLEPDRGWPFDAIMGNLAAKPTIDGKELGKIIVNSYSASYNGGSQGNTSVILSLLDLSKIQAVSDSLSNFSSALASGIIEINAIDRARENSFKYFYKDYADIADFARNVSKEVQSQSVKDAADELLKILADTSGNGFIVACSSTGDKYNALSGLALFLPERNSYTELKKAYNSLGFSKKFKWKAFLDELETPNLAYLKIKEVILADSNHDGRITPGEDIEIKFVLKNHGKLKTQKVQVQYSTESNYLNLDKVAMSLLEIPAPGKEITISVGTFNVSPETPVNTQVVLTFSLSGENVPLSTYKTTFYVKEGFETNEQVLFVFTDAFSPAAPTLQDSLRDAKIAFDTWDRMIDGNIKTEMLKRYLNGWILVSVQDSSNQQQLVQEEIDALSAFLKSGGRLVLTGQDLAYSLRESPFLKDFCRASFVQDDTNIHVVSGVDGFFGGNSFQIYGGDGANNQKWPDEINTVTGGKMIMKYEPGARDLVDHKSMNGPDIKPNGATRGIKAAGGAAISYVDGFRVMLFSFGLEGINSAQQRATVLGKIKSFMIPTINQEILDLSAASERRSLYPNFSTMNLQNNVDMISGLSDRITKKLQKSIENRSSKANDALKLIETLPETQRKSISHLEKNIRSLLEFSRQHGTIDR